MIARMQDVAKDIKGGEDLMAKFYLEILPRVPARRGDEVSEYCVKLHEQAIAYLKEAKKTRGRRDGRAKPGEGEDWEKVNCPETS